MHLGKRHTRREGSPLQATNQNKVMGSTERDDELLKNVHENFNTKQHKSEIDLILHL